MIQVIVNIPLLYFNPRSHERSDGIRDRADTVPDISIHAPTRGATESVDDDSTKD